MLEALRRGAQTLAAKILFGILVFAFSIWGVADVFRGWGRGSLASVGSQAISTEEFNRSYQNELDRISRQSKQRLTPDQGHAIGLDKRVLGQLIGGTAIEQHARRLGLALSDDTIVDMVANDPDFKGSDGHFTREGFNAFLRQAGLSEQGFIRLKRQDELRAAVIGAFVKGQAVPKPMLETIYAYNNEKRVIEYLNIDPAKAVTVPEPDEAKLRELYEAAKTNFMTPEYRKFEMLTLSIDDLKKLSAVTDDEVAAEYERTKDSYNVPEKRRVQQIAFKDKAAAEAAKAALDGGKPFGEVAKDAGAKDTDVDLGLVEKRALIDKKIADAAFSLEKDKVSDPVQGTFSTALVRVTQIEPGIIKTLADVKDEVRNKIADAKAKQELQAKHDEIDDARNSGKTLKDLGETYKLPYKLVEASDSRGFNPKGEAAVPAAIARKLLEPIFTPDSGIDQQSIDIDEGAYAWANVLGTEAPKQRPFEEVKDQVKAQFMVSEKNRLIADLATALATRVNNGEALSALESVAGNTVQKTDAITRSSIPQGLSEAAVAQGFALQKGKAGSAETADQQSRAVIRVADVIPAPEPKKEDLDKITRQIEPELTNQALVEYTEALKKELGTKINEAELRRAAGVTEE